MNLTGCFLKQDRTTTVYGTITDQNGQPVDSILVMVLGMQISHSEVLSQIYSDKAGEYEIMVEVPKKFNSINVGVPFLLIENPKYQNNYKGKKTTKDGKRTSDCCTALVGKKTRYDFQLIPR
ncbi:hypothetical protein [Dyadobacter sp. CY323]|uniref:hypothetical protein n=1 Tax=Dyadobacter sp. CY323 TaxID=2907302 RepID=UPI001F2A2573|nr:hypothetical protein [Dyadobacter sp. CY323]MCE6989456.1 hypothetical protein [Dyadobacter sp. CY323]